MTFRVAPAITALSCALSLVHGVRSAALGDDAVFPQPSGWPQIQSQTVSAEQIGPGVRYERFTLATVTGPLVVSVATVDLRNPSVALAVATHGGVIVGRGERLSSMADGVGAELGINADYFDINESGSPLNLVATQQRVLHEPSRAATFVVGSQGQILMGPASWNAHLEGSGGVSRDITLVNEWSPSVQIALLTPQLGAANAAGATEMVLAPVGTAGQYRVARIDTELSSFDVLAVSELGVAARDAQAQALAHDFHPGDLVSLTEASDPPLSGIRAGVGGGPLLVRDGARVDDPAAPAPEETDVRNPVTGAGLSSDGATLWLVVVDGRRPAVSIGLTRPQLAALFLALGAKTAMAFDSGGSTEMVLRHAGDLTSSVANSPSDGRERSVADGLFVLNTAPRGPIATLVLRAPSAQVLAGSSMPVDVRAVDANEQPIAVHARDLTFATAPASVAEIDENGRLRALRPGDVQVSAATGTVQAKAAVRVVASVSALRVAPADPVVPLLGSLQLAAIASSADGQPVALDTQAVRWSSAGSGGRVLPDGTFIAGPRPARTLVSADAGGASASVAVLSGDHAVMFQAIPQPGASPGSWAYAAKPPELSGAVDASAAPDGSPALRLAYALSSAQGSRAAYAQTQSLLPGQPTALAIDVFGDGNGEWLRGGYRNADGNLESLTIARHIDWHGWKRIKVPIPAQSAWPIVWTRLYVVERSEAREQGSIWFRNFTLFYPGP